MACSKEASFCGRARLYAAINSLASICHRIHTHTHTHTVDQAHHRPSTAAQQNQIRTAAAPPHCWCLPCLSLPCRSHPVKQEHPPLSKGLEPSKVAASGMKAAVRRPTLTFLVQSQPPPTARRRSYVLQRPPGQCTAMTRHRWHHAQAGATLRARKECSKAPSTTRRLADPASSALHRASVSLHV